MLASSTIRIDVNRPGIVPRLYAMQGEKNVRHVVFVLYEDGVAWEPGENATVEVHFRRADGTGGSYSEPDEGGPAFSVLAGIVGIPINEAVCAKAGPVALTVELSADGAVIATWPVTVMVEANPGCQALEEETEQGSGGSGGATPYIIDLSEVLEVDLYGTSEVVKYPYDGIDYEKLLEAYTAGKAISIKVGRAGYDGSFSMTLNSSTEVTGISLSGVGAFGASTFVSFYIWGDSADSVGLSYRVTEINELIRTVNGVGPDEDGNVEVETAEEKPVKLDLSAYYDGVISRIYADGGTSDIAVTFDESGNPVSFSNGEETFEAVWPAEEATEEVTG